MSFQPPNIFSTSFEDVALGTRIDYEGNTDGHGLMQNAYVHSGTRAWRCWGLRQTLWTSSTNLQCFGGKYNGQTKILGDLFSEGLVASDSYPNTNQFERAGQYGSTFLLMMNADGSLPSPYAGPSVPNDGLYHWSVSNAYPRCRINRGTTNGLTPIDDIYLRVHFYLFRLDGYLQVIRLYTTTNIGYDYVAGAQIYKDRVLCDGVGGEITYFTNLTLNQWHYIEMRFKRSPIAGQGVKQVWLDNPSTPIINGQNLNTTVAMNAQDYHPWTGLVLSGSYPSVELDFVVDDFAGSTQQIGPASASPTANLTVDASIPNVDVFVGGNYWGTAPQSRDVPLGNQTIEVPPQVIV